MNEIVWLYKKIPIYLCNTVASPIILLINILKIWYAELHYSFVGWWEWFQRGEFNESCTENITNLYSKDHVRIKGLFSFIEQITEALF